MFVTLDLLLDLRAQPYECAEFKYMAPLQEQAVLLFLKISQFLNIEDTPSDKKIFEILLVKHCNDLLEDITLFLFI